MEVTEQTEVTIRIPRHEASMIAEAVYEIMTSMGGCCKCTSPDAFANGDHNWRSDPRLLRDLYNQLRPAGWQPLLMVGLAIFRPESEGVS